MAQLLYCILLDRSVFYIYHHQFPILSLTSACLVYSLYHNDNENYNYFYFRDFNSKLNKENLRTI